MKASVCLWLCLLIIFAAGCNRTSKEAPLNIPTEQIDLAKYQEVNFSSLPDEYVKQKKYVSLEMKDDENYVSLISKVKVMNDKIFILDKRKKILVQYDGNGKYLGKVGKLKEEYLNIADFDVDDNGNIYIIDGKLDRMLVYDTARHLQYVKKTPFETDILKALSGGELLLGLSSWNEGDYRGQQVIRTDKQLEPLEKVLRYNEYVDDNFWITGYRFLQVDSLLFYNKPVDNNVYVFSTAGKIKKAYQFNFGALNVPDADKKDIEKKVDKYNHYRLLSEFTYVTDKYALGQLWDKRKFRFFYADRNRHIVYLQDTAAPNELKSLSDFDGKTLSALIYPGDYDEKAFASLPPDTKSQLEKGGFVVCKYELN
ncbi:6-bladed beta-propeller [Chitinophaga solisilvae]|uniref:6-bladed beta-propeller n=1 Tax=Chitinophaga solisilvae TaxID=1233460 RepID=UPI00136C8644|nr:6-bladed beta-propeller [Chitinophaga solisilvae]